MAHTVNSHSEVGKAPKTVTMFGTLDVDCDNSYPDGGYSLVATLPQGVKVVHSDYVPDWDGAALRWLRIVDVAGVPKLKVYANDNGAPGAEVAALTNLVGHTHVVVGWFGE